MLRKNGIDSGKERDQEVRRLLASLIPDLRLGRLYQAKALDAIDAYLSKKPDADGLWKAAIAEAAKNTSNPEQIVNRVKKLPFAVMKVTVRSKSRFVTLSENGQLPVGSRTYNVPVIANPTRKYMPNLEEAVVLTAATQ